MYVQETVDLQFYTTLGLPTMTIGINCRKMALVGGIGV